MVEVHGNKHVKDTHNRITITMSEYVLLVQNKPYRVNATVLPFATLACAHGMVYSGIT